MSLTAASSLALQRERTNKKPQRTVEMPIGGYYQGHGNEVMNDMQKRYGDKEGKSVFYATANKRDQKPEDNRKPKPRRSFGQRLADRGKY